MALTDNLVAYWRLSEATAATRASSVGTYNLADNNSVAQVVGKLGNAAGFTASSYQWLQTGDTANLRVASGSFTINAWVKLASKPAPMLVIVSKSPGTGAKDIEYRLGWDQGPDRFSFVVGDNTSSYDYVISNTGAPSLDTWYMVTARFDKATGTAKICVNASANNTNVNTASAGYAGTGDFYIGQEDPYSTDRFFDGAIDDVGIWNRELSDAEVTSLYNSGTGLCPLDAPPAAPGSFTATAVSSTEIDLSWTDVTGETGYTIERSPNGSSSWVSIATPAADATSYNNTSLSPNTHYYYRIKATNASGDSSYSTADATTDDVAPSAPTTLTFSSVGSTGMMMEWVDTASNETGFDVEYGTDSGYSGATSTTAAADATSKALSLLLPNTLYYVRVRATNGVGGSSWLSGSHSTAPDMPGSFTATMISGTEIDLSWTDVTGETGYTIERSPNGSTGWVSIATPAADATSYNDIGLDPLTHYYYRIYATNAGGNSDYSTADATTDDVAPNAPTTLTFSGVGPTGMTLNWVDTASNETGFDIEYGTDVAYAGAASTTAAANATSKALTGLAANTLYYVRVRATNGVGSSGWLEGSHTTSPAAPGSFTATAVSSTEIDLSWDDVTGETGYTIERSPNGSTGWVSIATPAADATSYNDTSLSATTHYYYRIYATNAGGDSGYSTADAITDDGIPSAPTTLTFTGVSSTGLTMNWVDTSSDETSFDIEYGTDSGYSGATSTTAAANATSKALTSLTASTLYYVRVRATNAYGSSDWLEGSQSTVPDAPGSFTATAASHTEIDLTWDDVTGETGYTIERSPNGSTGWAPIATPAADATSYNNTGLSASTHYYYRIYATNSGGNSAYATADATTNVDPDADLEAPTPPVNFAPHGTTATSILLRWEAATDNVAVTGYNLYRADLGGSVYQSLGASDRSYTDTGLTADTDYAYSLTAIDAYGNESSAAVAEITTEKAAATILLRDYTSGEAEDVLGWISIPKPTTSTGDTLILVLNTETLSPPPSGWTQVFSTYPSGGVYRKVAGSSEPSRYGFSLGMPGNRTYVLLAYSGVNTTAPINVSATSGPTPLDVTSVTAPAVTTTINSARVLHLYAGNGTSSLVAADPTGARLTRTVFGVRTLSSVYTYDHPQAAAGSVAAATLTLDTAEQLTGYTLALTPSASGGDVTAPTQPTISADTPTAVSVRLTWTAATDAVGVTGYKLYRDDNGPGVYQSLPTTPREFTDTGLTPGTSYTYQLSAVDGAGNESTKSSVVVTTGTSGDVTPPTAPAVVTDSPSGSSIHLVWSGSTDDTAVVGYRLYRSDLGVGIYRGFASTDSEFTDTGLSPNTAYTYQVSAFDAAGNESTKTSVTTYTSKVEYLSQFGSPGAGDGQLNTPHGVSRIGDEIFVADANNNRICVFDMDGNYLRQYATPTDVAANDYQHPFGLRPYGSNIVYSTYGNAGSGGAHVIISPEGTRIANELYTYWPYAVAVNGTTIYATGGSTTMAVEKLDGALSSLGNLFTTTSVFNGGAGIAIDVASDKVFVSDYGNHVIRYYSLADGHYRGTFGTDGTGNGQIHNPMGMCVWQGSLWVADAGNDRVVEFGLDGTWLANHGVSGTGDGEFDAPRDVYGAGNLLWVSDGTNGRVQTFTVDTEAPTGAVLSSGSHGMTTIALSWTAATDNVGVAGYRLYRADQGGSPYQSFGSATLSFTDTGLTPGTSYTYQVTAIDTAGNESAPSALTVTTSPPGDDSTPPTEPQLSHGAITDTTVVLNWTASADNVGVTGYRLYRSDKGSGVYLTLGAGVTTVTDTGLTAGSDYDYSLSAIDASGGESTRSALTVTTTGTSNTRLIAADIAIESTVGVDWFNLDNEVELEATFAILSQSKRAGADAGAFWVAEIVAYSGVDQIDPIAAVDGWYCGDANTFETPEISIPVENSVLLAIYNLSAECGDDPAYEYVWTPDASMTEREAAFYIEGTKKDADNKEYTVYHGIHVSDQPILAIGASGQKTATGKDYDQIGGDGESGHPNLCRVAAQLIALRPRLEVTAEIAIESSSDISMGVPITAPASVIAIESSSDIGPLGFPVEVSAAIDITSSSEITLGTPVTAAGTIAIESGAEFIFGNQVEVAAAIDIASSSDIGILTHAVPATASVPITTTATFGTLIRSTDSVVTFTLHWRRKGIKA